MSDKTEGKTENREGEFIAEFPWNERGEMAQIKFAETGDLDGLIAIDKDRADIREQVHKISKSKEKIENIGGQITKNLTESLEHPDKLAFIVVKVGEEVVGYADFGPCYNPDDGWGPDTVRLHTISVLQMDPKYQQDKEWKKQGYGFGQQLLIRMIEQAKIVYGAKHIQLNTHNWNKSAQKMYERNGFEHVAGEWRKDEEGKSYRALDPVEDQWVPTMMMRYKKDLE